MYSRKRMNWERKNKGNYDNGIKRSQAGGRERHKEGRDSSK